MITFGTITINPQPMNYKIKFTQILLVILVIAYIGFIIVLAETNYNDALEAVRMCDGTDTAITETMKAYGFTVDIFEPITFVDKLKALIN